MINVLQVTPKGDKNSELTNTAVLNQTYRSNDDYLITIKTTDIEAFNTKGSAVSYDKIGGQYDMLIFGFRDSYNVNSTISDDAANAVNAFIKTGQSVMFTHDTVYINSGTTDNVWTSNFKESTGQTGTFTNIGRSARKQSTTVSKINDGLLTRFPFNLDSDTPDVASTHDQYFMLNLEDPSIVSWYNITGGTRDPDDSYNHYYTYSKGNVTYSGTGHVFSGNSGKFPKWEQYLFINTMYRAYMGSNHKPELTVYAPAAYSEDKDNVIPAYQEIPVSFLPQDPDLTDRKLHVKIEFTYTSGGKEVTETKYDSAQTDSGSVFSASYKNPLPTGGDLTIRIYAADKQGAWTEEIIPVKIREISANLQVSRSASGLLKDTLAERGKEFQLTYSIVPKPVQNQTGQAELMAITAPAFLPRKGRLLTWRSPALPVGISKSGTLAAGYTLSGGLPDIRDIADGSGKTSYPTCSRQPPGDGQGDADRQLSAEAQPR